ncbi:amidohydrolase [Entomomonas asaccharolytica]|uniref:Omega-amidase YafV n=1 Tax=Entomomonas asaccharolytica TaxID=2785331 RepID=A0A974NGX5_9GAMM|nr:amidohydrolase [Entomomonas asaccharolytica]QQP86610.1 amidohydrolase [Entomomonas asaccharolytica]
MRSLEDLNIALVQTDLVWQSPEANKAHFDQIFEQAKGTDLVILPEMFTTGFSMDAEKLAESEDGQTIQWLRQSAIQLQAVVTGSLIIRTNSGKYFNRLFWARPDGTMVHYDKRHLFRMANEHMHYSAGEHQLLVEHKGWKIRPLICYDLRFPVWSRDPYNTDLLLYVANWPSARRQQWNRLLPARAIENLCYTAAVNRIGKDGKGYPYSGDSQLLDYLGEQLINCQDKAGIFNYTLSGSKLLAFRESFPAYQDADMFELK